MKTNGTKRSGVRMETVFFRRAVYGWTLVEMVGVLAVFGLLMGLSVPTLQDLSARESRDAEIRQVTRLIVGLRSEVRRRGVIPGHPDSIRFMAAGVGLPESVVRFNPAGQQRLLLRDPAMRLAGVLGSTGAGVGWSEIGNVRFLLVSSVGDPLPAEELDADLFQALWDLPPGRTPEGWRWKGRAEDLVLGRIDLQPEFVRVGWSDVDAAGATIVVGDGPATTVDGVHSQGWLLTGTAIALLDQQGAVCLREVIDAPTMYRYERGQWYRSGLWTPEPSRPSAQDFARMADGFLRISADPLRNGVSPREVWAAFSRFSIAVGGRCWGGVSQEDNGELIVAHGDLERLIWGLVGKP